MKTVALLSAMFLAGPGIDAPKRSLMPNVHKAGWCGQLPPPPPGCMASSAKCLCRKGACAWHWTC